MNYGTVTNTRSLVTRIVQGSDPEDLAGKIFLAMTSLNPATQVITSVTLAGAGDGFTFVALIEGANIVDCDGGLPVPTVAAPIITVFCYLAATADDLVLAKAAAGVPAPLTNPSPPPATLAYSLIDEQMAGSSKGTRFMGMSVYYLSLEPSSVNTPAAVATLSTPAALSAGITFVSFDTIQNLNPAGAGFSLPAPQTVEYDGGQSRSFNVDGNMTVQSTSGGAVAIEVHIDPLASDLPILGGISKTTLLAAGVECIPFTGLCSLTPSGILLPQSKIGVLINMPTGGGHVSYGTLRLSPVN